MRMIIIRDVSIRTRPPRVNAATATLVLLGVAVPLVAALWVGAGQLEASPAEVVRALAHRLGGADDADLDPALVTVIWRLRLPRILVGLCAGAVLSVGGACLQAVVRNDLADPYLLGVSSGASLGAALVIAGGAGGALTTTGGAFLGALAALVLVMALAGGGGRLSGSRLVLAGLTAGYFLSAVTNLVVVLSDSRDAVRAITFWMLGSLNRSSWADVPVLACAAALTLGYLVLRARALDAVGLGDDVARSMGVNVGRTRLLLLLAVGWLSALITATCGPIAFLGLAAPHLARLLFRTALHRTLLPAAFLTGAALALLCLLISRWPGTDSILPINAITPLIGAPLVIVLLLKK